jgi:WD40 repeat protein
MKRLFLIAFLLLFTQFIFAQTYKPGDAVNIEWKGKWYPGKILEVQKNGYKISYDGYGADWYETVTTARLKPAETASIQTTNNQTANVQTINQSSFSTINEASYKGVETINDLSLSNDAKTLVAANAYGKITILNAADLTLVADIKVSSSPVGTVAINSTNNYLAAADSDGKIYIYFKNNAGEWSEYTTIAGYSMVNRLEFSPKSNDLFIAAAPKEDYTKVILDVWNLEDKKVKMTLLKSTNANHAIGDIAINKDGSKVAFSISNAKKGIEIYDTETGKLSMRIDTKSDMVGIAFSPDGSLIASGGTDKKLTLWNVATKKTMWTSTWNDGLDAYVYGIAYAPDGLSIAVCGSGSGKKIKIYSAADGKMKCELGESNPGGNSVCFSPNSKIVYTGLRTFGDIAKVAIVYMSAIPE